MFAFSASRGIEIKTRQELECLRVSGRITAEVCAGLTKEVGPGVTTKKLDQLAGELIARLGAKPAFMGYRGYPANICASLNDEVVHGIPSDKRVLREGDIISLDLGVVYAGFYGDIAVTLPVGKISKKCEELLAITEESLYQGIKKASAGNRLQDISAAVQGLVESNGCSVVRSFVGHGIGRQLHEDPMIPNFLDPGEPNPQLRAGMVLAIEPMVNIGGWAVKVLSDGWTVVTVDGSLSAHFEHMVAITEQGPEILTRM
ncbi:MAG: type I methionyl aminopeptidase [Elusimicrobiota bacterium]